MSFGKDPNVLNKLDKYGIKPGSLSLSQRERALAAMSGGGGTRQGPFLSKYDPGFRPTELAGKSDKIRLIRGSYKLQIPSRVDREDGSWGFELYETESEFFKFVQHYNARNKKSTICSGGPLHFTREHRKPCRGCDIFYEFKNSNVEAGYVSKSHKYVWNVLHIHKYHEVPQTDFKTKQIKVNPRTNQPYMTWEPCVGRGCQHCQMSAKVVDAMMRPFKLSKLQHQYLLEKNSSVENDCTSCGSQQSIETTMWLCSNCDNPIIDLTSTSLTDEQISALTSRPYNCPKCKNIGLLQEKFWCTQCNDARRASLFDVDIDIRTVVTDPGNPGQPQTKKTQLDMVRISAPSVIDPKYSKMAVPFDFPRVYVPDSWSDQINVYGEPSPEEGTPVHFEDRTVEDDDEESVELLNEQRREEGLLSGPFSFLPTRFLWHGM